MYLKRLASFLLPVAALAACAGQYGRPLPGPDDVYDDEPYGGGYDAPLRAQLTGFAGDLDIRLSSPAHVAVFEIVPGRGVGLMYPAYQREPSLLAAGFNRLSTQYPRTYAWNYSNASSRWSTRRGPRTLLLVASRAPLRISRFQREPGSFRNVLGLSYSSVNPYSVADELVSYVVPPQHDDDWTTDIYTIWPNEHVRGSYADDGLVVVPCPDGTLVVVPVELYYYACNRWGRADPPPLTPGDSTGTQPGDSVQVPTRRRPPPVTPGQPAGTSEAVVEPVARPRVPQQRPGPTPFREGSGSGTGRSAPRASGDGESDKPRNTPRPSSGGSESPRSGGSSSSSEGSRPAPAPRAEPRSEPRPAPAPARAEPRAPAPSPAPAPSRPAPSGKSEDPR